MMTVRGVEAVTTPRRIEAKLPISASLLGEAEAWVRLHPAHWRRSYPPRQVNNIYLDSGDYAGLNANLAGIPDRSKLRLRWYGPHLHLVTGGQLELKCKQGAVGWKQILPLSGTYDLTDLTWSALLRQLEAILRAGAHDWLVRYPVPVLINSYQRAYYETPDGELRLTLDSRLRAFGQRARSVPNLSGSIRVPERAVIELKGGIEDAPLRRLSAAVAALPVRVDRFSKYVSSVMALPDFF
jgi:hypothetical protein